MAALAELQQALLRLGKGLEGRAGRRGRSPFPIEELTKLHAVGITKGSAVLELHAPAIVGQLPLTDIGLEALDTLEEALEAAGQGNSLPDIVDPWSREKIAAFLQELTEYDSLEIEDRRGAKSRRLTLVPALAADAIRPHRIRAEVADSLSGYLYEVNLKNGSFRVEDDLGRSHYMDFDTSGNRLDLVRELIGRRVVAQGVMSSEPGHQDRFEASSLSLAQPLPQDRFFDFDLQMVLDQIQPIQSVADLRIDDFDEMEAELFWSAITE